MVHCVYSKDSILKTFHTIISISVLGVLLHPPVATNTPISSSRTNISSITVLWFAFLCVVVVAVLLLIIFHMFQSQIIVHGLWNLCEWVDLSLVTLRPRSKNVGNLMSQNNDLVNRPAFSSTAYKKKSYFCVNWKDLQKHF